MRLKNAPRPPDFSALNQGINSLRREKESAIASQDFEEAARLRNEAGKLEDEKAKLLREWQEQAQRTEQTMTVDTIVEAVERMTGRPIR